MYIITFHGPTGAFHHAIAEPDEVEVRKHFELLKVSRNRVTIPIMRLWHVELTAPLEEHVKGPKEPEQPAPLPAGYTVEKQADGTWGLFYGGGYVARYRYLSEAIAVAKADAADTGER